MELTDEQRQVLEFAKRWYHLAGAREQAIRDELGLNATRYHQILLGLITETGWLVSAPEFGPLVKRLRGIVAARKAQANPRRRVA